MKNQKYIIYILISLMLLLFLYNFLTVSVEGLSGSCKILSQEKSDDDSKSSSTSTSCSILSQQTPPEPTISNAEFERNALTKLNTLGRQLDTAIYPLKYSAINAETLESIGPMQQSISDSQSGDVTGDTKITGL
uniref:Uncharacterized protein n=1 Tax=viral metagenome TaxID=1070528 RepID=A0A6C0AW04_9ZZZZ|tara:strand:+ start:14389 stop:14790 length:402 start_codon:yes stop_codon:yes gene_type:complete